MATEQLKKFRNIEYEYVDKDDTFVARGLQLNMLNNKINEVIDNIGESGEGIFAADVINEFTLNAGVTIEGVLIRDAEMSFNGPLTTNGLITSGSLTTGLITASEIVVHENIVVENTYVDISTNSGVSSGEIEVYFKAGATNWTSGIYTQNTARTDTFRIGFAGAANTAIDYAFIGKSRTDTSAVFYADGAVELYYNDSKMFETTATGVILSGTLGVISTTDLELLVNTTERCFRGIPNGNTELYWDNTLRLEAVELGVGIIGKMESLTVSITNIKSGATQSGAGAAANEVWKTTSHASLPDNTLMIGV